MDTILICDDDKDIVAALEIYLQSEGFQTRACYNGIEAIDAIREGGISLILMDVMMPLMDGIKATLAIRAKHNVPILMLTAKSEGTDKVLGLNIGADDYITKPFDPIELIARVKAHLRRFQRLGSAPITPEIIRVGDIEIHDEKRKVTVFSEEVSLTPTEYQILKLLMMNQGKVYSSSDIYEQLKGDGFGSENTVAVHIRHLREKIEIDPANPRWIKVVWGQGYKLEEK